MNTMTAVLPKARHARTLTNARTPPRPPAKIKVADRTLESLSDIFKLLADKSRLKILLALAEQGELHVSALCDFLEQSQPAVSHHLTLLRLRNLVGYRRDGKHNYYRIHSELLGDLLEQLFHESGNGQRQIHFDDFSLAYRRK